jgi:site-specific recombinase XerD
VVHLHKIITWSSDGFDKDFLLLSAEKGLSRNTVESYNLDSENFRNFYLQE